MRRTGTDITCYWGCTESLLRVHLWVRPLLAILLTDQGMLSCSVYAPLIGDMDASSLIMRLRWVAVENLQCVCGLQLAERLFQEHAQLSIASGNMRPGSVDGRGAEIDCRLPTDRTLF